MNQIKDGEVKFWDLRTNQSVITIKPYEHEICTRPEYGRMINCLAIDEDNWLVCGGGPKLSIWHLRQLKPMSVIEPTSMYIPNKCVLNDNQVRLKDKKAFLVHKLS